MLSVLFSLLAFYSVTPEQALKSVFVVGDSISIHYGSYLEADLKGHFLYDRKRDDAGVAELGVPSGANGGDSRMVLEYLKARQKDSSFRPDILVVNCGLHDIKRDLKNHRALQVEPQKYRDNLRDIYTISQDIGAKMVWLRTTPVVDAIHNKGDRQFHRYADDLSKYNKIADRLFAELKVPVLDLHGFTAALGEEIFIDHVHYDQATRALQAAFIAGFLQNFK